MNLNLSKWSFEPKNVLYFRSSTLNSNEFTRFQLEYSPFLNVEFKIWSGIGMRKGISRLSANY